MSPAYNWAQLAQMHKPTDQAGLTAAARQMASQGLTPRDISVTLGLTETAVSALLHESEGSPAGQDVFNRRTLGIRPGANRRP